MIPVARPGARGAARAFLLLLPPVLFPFFQIGITPALPSLAADMHVGAGELAWVMSAFLISCAVAAPLLGRLGDAYGHRRVLIVTLVIVGAGSALAVFASDFWLLVVGRVLQGSAGGVLPLSVALIRRLLPAARQAPAIGLLTALVGLAAGFALLSGGLLTDAFSFRAVFTADLAAVLAALGCAALLPPSTPPSRRGRVDFVGAIVLGVGTLLVVSAITEIGHFPDGLLRALVTATAGTALLVALVAVELRSAHPLLNVRLLRRPAVLWIDISTLLVNIAGFAVFLLVPQLAQLEPALGGFGSSATEVGVFLLPGAVLTIAAGPAFSRLGARIGHPWTAAIAASVVAAGMAGLALFTWSALTFFIAAAVALVGLNLAFGAMTNALVSAVPGENVGEATGINSLARTTGNALGSQMTGVIVAGGLVAPAVDALSAFSAAFLVSAVIGVAGSVAALGARVHGREGAAGPPAQG